MEKKDKLLTIGFILLFIAADTYFIRQYVVGMGLSPFEAILIGLGVAALLDSAAYFASSFGLVELTDIPKKNKPRFKWDMVRASLVFLLVGTLIILSQVYLVNMRLEQISGKKNDLAMEQSVYATRVNAINNDPELSEIEKRRLIDRIPTPQYEGVEILDEFSVVVPIITTVLSFALAIVFRKKYEDRFENKIKRLRKARNKIEKKRSKINGNYGEKKDIFLGLADDISLEENITSQKLAERRDDIIRSIENTLSNNAKATYIACSESLPPTANEILGNIKTKLSELADNPKDFDNNFIIREQFKEKLAILESLDDKIIMT